MLRGSESAFSRLRGCERHTLTQPQMLDGRDGLSLIIKLNDNEAVGETFIVLHQSLSAAAAAAASVIQFIELTTITKHLTYICFKYSL